MRAHSFPGGCSDEGVYQRLCSGRPPPQGFEGDEEALRADLAHPETLGCGSAAAASGGTAGNEGIAARSQGRTGMSIQPGRPMLAILRETLRKMECSQNPETPDQTQLRRILRQRIAKIESVQETTNFRAGK